MDQKNIKPQYGASIKVDNRPAAYEWLREHGHDDIIKNTISCQFGRGEDDLASSFKAFAEKQGYVPTQTERSNPCLYEVLSKNVLRMVMSSRWSYSGHVGQRAVITKAKGAKNGRSKQGRG